MIPKQIFFTHENKSYIIKDILQEWKQNNPDFTFHFYNREKRENFLKKYYPQFFMYYMSTNSEYGALRADIWRYLIIYHHGGVYIDHKVRILKSLSSTLDLNAELCVSYKGDKRSLYTKLKNWICEEEELIQYCFAGKKKSKQLKKVIDLMLERLKQQRTFIYKPWKRILYPGTGHSGVYGVFYTTGPLMFTDALKDSFDKMKIWNNEFDESIEYPILKLCSFTEETMFSYGALHLLSNSYHFCTKKILTEKVK